MLLAANTPRIIRTIAPTRSIHAARLKKSHHKMINSAPTTPPSMPTGNGASGMTMGPANITSSWTIAIVTPGHSRKGLREVIS